MTKEKVLEALSNVQEPDLGKDIVTLNMVKDIEIDGNYISFTVVLTTPACPLKDLIKHACVNAIKLLINKEATVNVKFTSQTTTTRKDGQALLPKVKNIIAVVSGKGGVGKSHPAIAVGEFPAGRFPLQVVGGEASFLYNGIRSVHSSKELSYDDPAETELDRSGTPAGTVRCDRGRPR